MENTLQLNQDNLAAIGNHIPVPNYNRTTGTANIVHIGVGGFHRAHLAYYLHQLKQGGTATKWNIIGIGLREADKNIHEVLKAQDHLYTLMVKNPDGKIEPEVIGSIVDFKMGTTDSESVIAQMAEANTKIVSLTITEGGYNFNPTTGEFNFDNPDIQHELRHPNDPITVYGFLAAALQRRRDAGLPAFTIMSCDNIEHNGDMARKMLLTFAEAQDQELANWIAKEVSFPNSMVDRITPVTTPADIETLAQNFGVQDAWPVTCEPFIQWVVEDKFPNGRPDFEKVGVQFVPDVGPYEKMKLRLLNAGHSVLGLLGALHGHPTINACVEDELFANYLRTFLDEEATPVLGDIKGINLTDYKNGLIERFANPNIKDSVSRICSESSAKLPKFLIATIHENLATGGSIKFATLVLAAWCYYSDKKVNQNGQPLEIIDAMQGKLHDAAKETANNSLAFIQLESLFGGLSENERFTSCYTFMRAQLYKTNDIKKLMQSQL
ncbi:mannitol dehydrogenase family protein [Maribacter algarum]|uniref:Mannitol dehydrogenase family protein n=1 Tax=Maribacter algarum (ex Zhang et al. 2020) TaxID=2578118 RepID=A0A5S3PRB5_9FLAO|nr:mannitol dehydrogenase family protein [Maribacter algarum]TMM57169.1 mannitol dehydrogenase family protein [Maribacter algarum]